MSKSERILDRLGEDCEAANLAEAHVLKYTLDAISNQPEGTGNDLTAAQVCGCGNCVKEYFSKLDWLTRNSKLSDQIATSQGIQRPERKVTNYRGLNYRKRR